MLSKASEVDNFNDSYPSYGKSRFMIDRSGNRRRRRTEGLDHNYGSGKNTEKHSEARVVAVDPTRPSRQ